MKRALVTGSAGFVGRHMAAELFDRGWEVHAADIVNGHDAHEIFRGGGDAPGLFGGEVGRYDLVAHAAATAPHRAAIDGQPMNLALDLALDAAMFEWAVRTGQRRVLYLSSSAAYPIDLQDDLAAAKDLREEMIRFDRYNIGAPDASYGWMKLTGERIAAAAAQAGLAVHVVRPFSGYGTDQGEQWPFGAFIARALRREDPFTIWGSGEQVRDWLHIDDLVAGALAVVDADVREPVNLCTGRGTSMRELAAMVCAEVGYRPRFELREGAPAGVAYRVGDPARMHRIFQPAVSIEDGVRRALASAYR
ncbi:epimerase [Spongiactinospora rosea]|uniref:Epimerase n=1 Tax=Spongiactinospora rosea TaxID=2248750 RepID=A0A366M822_9ACTN|nr:NAD-dependent epimerase/dehydratase family protein [Spongiactinospora rosea]RBQ21612.1 epimerase [Spongiactinospora rosea]